MSPQNRIAAGRRRVLIAVVFTTIMLVATHAAVEAALAGAWRWEIVATDVATGLLVVGVAFLYLRAVARERWREAIEHMLLDLLATPRNIEDTASQALRLLMDYRVADAAVVAITDESGTTLSPMATRGYPRGWADTVSPLTVEAIGDSATLERPKKRHTWLEDAGVDLGRRPWTAHIPLRSGDDVIGVILLGARRRGALRDPAVLELLAFHLSAAFDHAALYEAAYAREQALEDLEVRRREFMAAIAHEIRTPLTSIQAFADLLQMGQAEMDDTARELVTSLGQGVQRLSSMVNDLIDLGRSGDATYAMQAVPVDIGEVIRTAEATLRPALVLREQKVTLDLPESGPVVLSDPRIVEQVVLNLLSNANRHSPHHGCIHVSACQLDHNTVRLEVSDDGPGVPEAERERIFEPYYRVRDAASIPGSGLGLAVARRLLEENGGRIWAGTAETGGARFYVEFRAGRT